MYLALVTFLAAGINVLGKILGFTIPMLDPALAMLGFVMLVATIYIYNKFEFKSLLDLALLVIITAGLAFVAISPAIVPQASLLMQIYSGFGYLMGGLVVGGIVSIGIGLVNLKAKVKL
jgi:hypothetical protein